MDITPVFGGDNVNDEGSASGSIRSQLQVTTKPVQQLLFPKKLCGFTFNFDDQMEGELYRSRVNIYQGPDYKVPEMAKKEDIPESAKEKMKSNKKYGKSKDSVSAKVNSKGSVVLDAASAAGYLLHGNDEGSDLFNDDDDE